MGDAPAVLLATCLDCRSGDLVGGFLGLLGSDAAPGGAPVHVIAWGGDVAAWRSEWRVPSSYVVHAAVSEAGAARVRRALGVEEREDADLQYGFARVYDASGRWRSTFHVGQLDRAQLRHDLAAVD